MDLNNGQYSTQLDMLSVWHLCDHLSFNQMKTLRGVCRMWKVAVEATHRFRNCNGFFDQGWRSEVACMDYRSCHRFQGLHFRFFIFKRNRQFEPYNVATGLLQNITRIKMEYVKQPCQEVVTFLHRCPSLQEVFFNRCKFKVVKYRHEMGTILRGGVPRPYDRSSRTCCMHINGLAALRMNPAEVIPPRIHTIQLQHSDAFPLCLIEYLFTRSEGVLQKFALEYSSISHKKRAFWAPTKEDLDARITNFLVRNRATLQYLSIFRIRLCNQLLSDLTAKLNAAGARFNLTELILGESYCFSEREQAVQFFAFLTNSIVPETLHYFRLRLWHAMNGNQLLEIVRRMVNLRSLFLDLHLSLPDQPVLINPLMNHLPHLRELDLWDRRIRRIPSMTSDFLPNGVPASLTRLNVYNRNMTAEQIGAYLALPRAHLLTHFVIETAPKFTNAMMQTVINNMPLLQVLGVSCCHKLNDSGLTGLPEETCKRIIKSSSGIFYRCGVRPEALVGSSLSQLSRLRKLTFYCCPNVSDISIFLAFRFPQIKEIDLSICLRVTDVGLQHLGRNNPSLETIMLLKNQRITHFGISSLVRNHPNIRRIFTSRRCCDRKMDKQIPYLQDPRFSRVVRIHPRIYRRPHNYDMY